MLFGTNVALNGCDVTLYLSSCYKLWPSSITCKLIALLGSCLAQATRSDIDLAVGVSKYEHSELTIGNKIAFVAGKVQVRSAGPPAVPAKNQTGPFWFWEQYLPVGSVAALICCGIEINHCSHLAVHLAYDTPYGLEYSIVPILNLSKFGMPAFSILGIVYMIGQYLILQFVKNKSKRITTRDQLHLNVIHRTVLLIQYGLAALIVFFILEMIRTSAYSTILLTITIGISYILSMTMLGLLAKRFFSWFRSNRYFVVFLYGLSSIALQ